MDSFEEFDYQKLCKSFEKLNDARIGSYDLLEDDDVVINDFFYFYHIRQIDSLLRWVSTSFQGPFPLAGGGTHPQLRGKALGTRLGGSVQQYIKEDVNMWEENQCQCATDLFLPHFDIRLKRLGAKCTESSCLTCFMLYLLISAFQITFALI